MTVTIGVVTVVVGSVGVVTVTVVIGVLTVTVVGTVGIGTAGKETVGNSEGVAASAVDVPRDVGFASPPEWCFNAWTSRTLESRPFSR